MPVVVIDPPVQVLDLGVVKQHLRVDAAFTDDDDLISIYMTAAQAMIDGPFGWLGRCVGQQTLELRLPGFGGGPIWGWSDAPSGLLWSNMPSDGALRPPANRVALPYPPLVSITSVTYEDGTGNDVVLPSASYLASDEGVDASYGTTFPDGRWAPDAVRIRYVAGYEAAPAPIVSALLLMVGDLYSNRQTVDTGVRAAAVSVPMSTTVEALLAPYRVYA